MEPLSTAVVSAATKETTAALKKESDTFLKAVYAEAAKALGSLLAVNISKRLHSNLIKITVEAKRKLAAAGVSPKEVPLSIIHPALQAAALEEDCDLQAVWANLLANAADPRDGSPVSRSFPVILKELSTREVRFLDALYESSVNRPQGHEVVYPVSVGYDKGSLAHIYVRAGLSRDPRLAHSFIEESHDAEAEAQLMYYAEHRDDLDADERDFGFMLDVVLRHGLLEHSQVAMPTNLKAAGKTMFIRMQHSYHFSQLGARFVRACRHPAT